ncbi:phosphohistidine phosphatase SixA [Endozoicomonas sp. SCSIO W0465]|uniref:phosphohistidine phosphatase SixA n=1 Tax=Endozoicomonas sp. SCSIO W0465 TaxID=2918516 RepID=UPI002074BBEF|nr:phosphohistidine phosphatase SixA [Endozoicomonas sp. SCSIO W0465]USE39289.1 phosphohistidine phosphatase SixA [Endozoicomonas sp. SCSIO W0465]
MKLIIMRHGQASWSAPSDQERSLTGQGLREVRDTTALLAGQRVDCVFASPYLRAQQTGHIVAEGFGLKVTTLDELEPDGDPSKVLDALPDSGVVLLASHMPMVSYLVGLLCDGTPKLGPSFQTGMALVLEVEMLAPGMGRVIERIIP